MTSNNDITEPLFESVKIISESVMSGLAYDTTIECSIVDASKRDNGEYRVSNGTATFIAYSENTEYREGQTVYVKIPQGDYNNDKLITGRKKDKDSSEPYIYHNPIDTVLDITGNLNPNEEQFGLIANAPETYYDQTYGITKDNFADYSLYIKNGDNYIAATVYQDDTIYYQAHNGKTVQVLDLRFDEPYYNFERFAVRAGFRSWLKDLNCVQGSYGLKLEVKFQPQNPSETATAYTKILYLNTSDMIGDVFAFDNFFQQSKVFDISQEQGIIEIKGWFYQDANFVDSSRAALAWKDDFDNVILSNLFINNIEILLGYDYTNYNEEFVKLFTFSNTTYGPNKPNDTKTVELKWVHIDDKGNRTVMRPTTDGNYEIRWYRYELGSPSDDSYSGVFYKRINPIDGTTWVNDGETKAFTCSFIPDSANKEEEKIKAVILFGDEPKIYRSDALTFTNNSQILNAPTLDAVRAVSLECDDLSYGNYYVYDEGNGLLPSFNKTQSRVIVCKFNLSATGETHNDFSDLTSTDSIIWKVPNKNTMLVIDENQTFDYGGKSVSSDDSYTTFTISNLTNLGSADNQKLPTLKYSIKSYYSAAANNNTITCIIKKGNVDYTGLLTFSFGQAGTTGTDYTLVLEMYKADLDGKMTNEQVYSIYVETEDDNPKENRYFIKGYLYDSANNLVKLNENLQIRLSRKWVEGESDDGLSMASTVRDNLKNLYLSDDMYSFYSRLSFWDTQGATRKYLKSLNYIIILQVSISGFGNYDLISYLPVPIRNRNYATHIDGADKVIYSTSGNPSYYKSPYKIFNGLNELSNIQWRSLYSKDKNGNDVDTTFLPTIELRNDGYYLKPKSLYIDGLQHYAIQAVLNNQVIWTQPILITQNEYFSSTINKWDGALKIDDSGNYILSKMIGAGKKNSSNQFSGVLMGDWGSNTNDSYLQTGLFGFQNGVMTYAFKDDGTGFIGPGKGRIEFDGTKGIIKSADYKIKDGVPIAGLYLDLQLGNIYAQNGNFADSINIKYTSNTDDGWFNGYGKKLVPLSQILSRIESAINKADTAAREAQNLAKEAQRSADAAEASADEAQRSADEAAGAAGYAQETANTAVDFINNYVRLQSYWTEHSNPGIIIVNGNAQEGYSNQPWLKITSSGFSIGVNDNIQIYGDSSGITIVGLKE